MNFQILFGPISVTYTEPWASADTSWGSVNPWNVVTNNAKCLGKSRQKYGAEGLGTGRWTGTSGNAGEREEGEKVRRRLIDNSVSLMARVRDSSDQYLCRSPGLQQFSRVKIDRVALDRSGPVGAIHDVQNATSWKWVTYGEHTTERAKSTRTNRSNSCKDPENRES